MKIDFRTGRIPGSIFAALLALAACDKEEDRATGPGNKNDTTKVDTTKVD